MASHEGPLPFKSSSEQTYSPDFPKQICQIYSITQLTLSRILCIFRRLCKDPQTIKARKGPDFAKSAI
jgi:hypothetical protein